jgi:AraC family transcriptional regulator
MQDDGRLHLLRAEAPVAPDAVRAGEIPNSCGVDGECAVPLDGQGEEVVADWPLARLVIRREAVDRERSWNAVKRDHTVMVNLGSGGGRFAVEVGDVSALYTPAPGDLSILPAGRTFVGMFQGRTLDYAVWMMSAATMDRLAAEAGLAVPVEFGVRLSHRDEFLYRALERLAALARSADPAAATVADGLNRAVALHLATVYDGVAPAPTVGLPDETAAALIDYVEARLSAKISVEELAAVAGLTPHALLPAFRARFGRSPLQYVIDQRLARARRLLAETPRPIAEIAYEVGLSSQSHLTNLFRSRFGVTPAAFRRAPR